MRNAMRTRSVCLAATAALSLWGCATDTPETSGDTDTTMTEQALSSSEHTAFNYFVAKGLTKAQSAGIVGNLIQESSVIPTAVEYGGGPGRGIAQWSVGGRWDSSYHDNVAWYAGQHGLNRWSLSTQLDFIWFELTQHGYGYAQLRAAGNVSDATIAFETRYEICGNCAQAQRISYAKQVLAAYGGGSTGDAGCYSHTLGREMPDRACVQSASDRAWYQCSDGAWVDRWTDPDACDGVHPL